MQVFVGVTKLKGAPAGESVAAPVVMVASPLLRTVTVRLVPVPTLRVPKSTGVGAKVTTGSTPVPLSAKFFGVAEAFELMLSVASFATGLALVGLKTTLRTHDGPPGAIGAVHPF